MSQSEEMARMAQDLVAEEHSYPTVGRTDAPEEPPPPARPQRRRRPPSRFSPSPARRRAARSPHIGLPSGRSGDPDSCDSCVLLPLRRVVRPAADHATSTPPAGGSADSSRSRAPSTCRSASAGHRGSLQQGGHREVTCDFWPQAPNICPPGLSRLANVRHQPTGTTTPMVATPLPVAMEMAAGPADLPLLKAQKSEVRSIKYTKTGDKYTGGWMNNLPHGIGTYIYKKAHAIYQGDWIHGKRSGYGTFDAKSTSTGEYIRVYAGNWRNGEKYGYGTYYYSKDARYEGGWECDQRSGYGKMIYANGDVYEGEWRNDKYCGRGVLLCGKKIQTQTVLKGEGSACIKKELHLF
ncbi:uncharacterized protein LOC143781416 isoform X2 [Ranitomeya variabilis]|uniref:uncharacterized protein LOC143781416 isoform X2 n=1 Tax=Ranitomeya variabilis TaxID=490064 RepID=UPI004057BC1F